jgi:hypothetical protein
MAGRSLIAIVTTAAPTTPPAGDACPGAPLAMPGVPVALDASMLVRDFPLMCAPGGGTDGVFSFVAPAAGNDVLVNVAATAGGAQSALALRTPCGAGGMFVGQCVGAGGRNTPSVWNRYQGLTAGTTYYAIGATTATTGMLSGRYDVIPHAVSMRAMGNDTCAGAVNIPETGGLFAGSTAGAMANFTRPGTCGCAPMSPDQVFRLVLTARRRVIVSTQPSAFDTQVWLQSGATCPGAPIAMPSACNDDAYGLNSALDITLDPGTYWLFIKGCAGGDQGTYTLDLATIPP